MLHLFSFARCFVFLSLVINAMPAQAAYDLARSVRWLLGVEDELDQVRAQLSAQQAECQTRVDEMRSESKRWASAETFEQMRAQHQSEVASLKAQNED